MNLLFFANDRNHTYASDPDLPSPRSAHESSYSKEIAGLDFILGRLEQLDPALTRDVVFDMMVKALLTGNVKKLARMIDDTLGRGAFKAIAEWRIGDLKNDFGRGPRKSESEQHKESPKSGREKVGWWRRVGAALKIVGLWR